MQIVNNGSSELSIIGNIKSIEDSIEIKNAINALQNKGSKSILVRIHDSFSMTSTVIGYLMKLVNLDKIAISMVVGDHRLYQLLEELSLVHSFNVRRISK